VGVLGLDALASAAYGPEALLTALSPLGVGAASCMAALLARAAPKCHRAAALPVVVISASVGEKGVPGATRFMRKPVPADVLVTLVREYCGTP
jgi:hypothetical protein